MGTTVAMVRSVVLIPVVLTGVVEVEFGGKPVMFVASTSLALNVKLPSLQFAWLVEQVKIFVPGMSQSERGWKLLYEFPNISQHQYFV